MKQNRLSKVGLELQKVFLQKKKENPKLKVISDDFGILFKEAPDKVVLASYNDCLCPLGIAVVGLELNQEEYRFNNDKLVTAIQKVIPSMSRDYFSSFWRGVDSRNGTYTYENSETKDSNDGYRDGIIFRQRYKIEKGRY